MSRPVKPSLRRATDSDFWRFFGAPAPDCWAGIVADDGRMLLGIGGVARGDDRRWWCHVGKAPGVGGLRAAKLMLRAAKVLFSCVRASGIAELYALADPRISRSEFYLQRLGFAPTDERRKGLVVWRWTR